MVSAAIPLASVTQRLEDAGLVLGTQGPQGTFVTGVSQDSRAVTPGDLFLAWKGVDHDGHDYVGAAVEAGALAAVVEQVLPTLEVPQIHVSNGRRAGALAADEVFGSPWTDLFLAGVTGTNGKTTVAVLARHLLGESGPARAFGTLGLLEEHGNVRHGTEGLTTPGPVQIGQWLREMVDQGIRSGVFEASSHSLAQHRLDGFRLDTAVFTNLTQDHLDYHETLAEYRDAKGKLLDLLKPGGWVVVNRDDGSWDSLPFDPDRTVSFGMEGGPGNLTLHEGVVGTTLVASDLEVLPDGTTFTLHRGAEKARVNLPLLGRFNVENALAAAGVALTAGLTLTQIANGLSAAPQVSGRLERVAEGPVTVLIDFAHTPDALERVLKTLRPLVQGRLLVLFGAGGDRDKGKRPQMGEVVARLADLSFVTSDNPRTEDPEVIIDDVVAGMGEAPVHRVADRRAAIADALEVAHPGDLLLLAGKGHETYQVIGLEAQPFDEAAIVKQLLDLPEGGRP